jgi:isopentenyldiphosphate isomerase
MTSLLAIVDNDDNVIGAKDKDTLTPDNIYRVARLFIVNSKHELLLAQRAFVKRKTRDFGAWPLRGRLNFMKRMKVISGKKPKKKLALL